MGKFTAYEKLSKKEKKKIDSKGRTVWKDYGCLSPVTKIVKDRKKEEKKRMCRKRVWDA